MPVLFGKISGAIEYSVVVTVEYCVKVVGLTITEVLVIVEYEIVDLDGAPYNPIIVPPNAATMTDPRMINARAELIE